jgi:DNA polymerase I
MANHNPPQLFLVDGYALIYRAFFAMISRPLRTAKGENTSAALGVVNFLMRLREKYRPDYVAWINDAGTSFREQRYADYKSTREKLDDELQSDFNRSVERICQLLEAFGIPIIAIPGYEADDVIGTLADAGVNRGLQVVIVSGDKDFYQLVGPRVALLNPGRGGPASVDETWVDEGNAAERLGVEPRQVVDFLALVGDSSDNIPGVKGIGGKGAQKLLSEYGDLDTILSRAADVSAKRTREALLTQADSARLSRELVTIKRDVPVELDASALIPHEPDREAVIRLLTELEFYALARKLTGQGGTGGPTMSPAPQHGDLLKPAKEPLDLQVDTAVATLAEDDTQTSFSAESWLSLSDLSGPSTVDVTLLNDPDELGAVVERLRAAPIVGLGAVSTSADPRDGELVGLSLAAGPEEVWYLPFGHRASGEGPLGSLGAGGDGDTPIQNLPAITSFETAQLYALLTDPAVPKAGHDIKFDWQVLRKAGVELAGVVYDSMLASFVLDPGRRSHALDTLCLEHLGRPLQTYQDMTGKGKSEISFAEVPLHEAANYCGTDSATVLSLHSFFAPMLREMHLESLLQDIEMPLLHVLVDMEWSGITIDRDLFRRLSHELGTDLARLDEEIARVAGTDLNLNSPRQLATVLFEKHQLPVLKKTKTGPSTDADVLEQLAAMGHELPRLILEYRELQKLKSTYVDTLPQRVNRLTGRIHTSFNQAGAATGRLSSAEPNLQNIPIRTPRGEAIRAGFVPREGWVFLVADYSQIELRIMAHLSEDPAFIDAFRQGGDIHRQTAALIFNVPLAEVSGDMRGRAKTINFATIYGQGPFALSRQLGISLEDARDFIARYFERFSGVRAFLDRQVELARQQGYVETLFKRRRYIPEIKERNFNQRSYGERNAQNSPLQGSAADLIKLAMVRIHRAIGERGLQSRMLLQVHDELVFETPPGEVEPLAELVRDQMENVAPLRVPLVVDIGTGPNWLEAKS